ncbi:mitohcondrial RNA polymerase [Scheffersomyces coipomensis]|uniref:mitohcondrial RNA polymerase n=1 Tax=Scheffersomyces coipomensis TaxID=1788519 RepID=UPI00315C4E35
MIYKKAASIRIPLWIASKRFTSVVATSSTSSNVTPSHSSFQYGPRQDSILDSTPFEIFNELEDKKPWTRGSHLKSSILINNFIQSVFNNDFSRSSSLLNKLSQRMDQYNNIHMDNYYSCMMLLLSNALSNHKSISIHNIKTLIGNLEEARAKISDRNDISESVIDLDLQVKNSLIIALLYAFSNEKSIHQPMRRAIATYIKKNINSFKISYKDICGLLNNKVLVDAFIEVSRLTGIKMDSTLSSLVRQFEGKEIDNIKQTVSINDYKDHNGFISFHRLCLYLQDSRFTQYDQKNGAKLKMYEIYDDLKQHDPKKADSFFNEYSHFNEIRQINVESNSLDLVEDLDSTIVTEESTRETDSPKKLSFREANALDFRNANAALLNDWLDNSVELLYEITKKLNRYDQEGVRGGSILTEDEKVLLRSVSFLNILPKKSLVLLVISSLLSQTMSAETGYVKVSALTQTLSYSFKRLLYKEKSLESIKKPLLHFFDEENHGIRLFSILLRMILKTCKIDLPAAKFNELKESCDLLGVRIKPEFYPDEDEKAQAFYHRLIQVNNDRRLGVIEIHPFLYDQLKQYTFITHNRSFYFPMIHPPKPWTSPTEGGYLLNSKPIVTTRDINTNIAYLNRAHKTNQLDSIYEGLNFLSQTTWAINPDVLEAFKRVMTYDKGFLKIPVPVEFMNKDSENFHEKKTRRLEYEMLLELAETFSENGEMIYSPHNVDFRGRAYPMSSAMNHYQEDSVRGLLMFWKSEPLGKDGYKWLKSQLASTFGFDKLSMKSRVKFVDDDMQRFLQIGKNPFESDRSWMEADKPFQALALCIELYKIDEFMKSGGNVEEYRSRIPVQQDGSCNGLQHYAALGADKEGGEAVNLVPQSNIEDRGDIYVTVRDIVESHIREDGISGKVSPEFAEAAIHVLTRKLVKRTVMTTVYGVTEYGATSQIEQVLRETIDKYDLKDEDNPVPYNKHVEIIRVQKFKMARYIAKIILNSISSLFVQAQVLQEWLTINTIRVINSFDLQTVQYSMSKRGRGNEVFSLNHTYKPMMWTTLSGFPVVQLYKQTKVTQIPTSLQRIAISRPESIAPINKTKQVNGVAPNFIHSLDAIHMLMTCKAAESADMTFVAVHDSYWTYASRATELATLLRQEFVRLHTSDIIEHLREDLIYSTRHSYQLAWIDNQSYPELVDQIKSLRETYELSSYVEKWKKNDKILYHELQSITKGEDDNPMSLVKQYDPKLYYQKSPAKAIFTEYGFSLDDNQILQKSKLTFTPVLVPVRILDCPKKGELDVSEVLKSPYFFS